MTSERQSMLPKDPVTWWREAFERDTDAFERAHGRRPMSMWELSRWLTPSQMRTLRNPETESN